MIPFPIISGGLFEQAMNLMWIEEIEQQELNSDYSIEGDEDGSDQEI